MSQNPLESDRDAKYALAFAAEEVRRNSRRTYDLLLVALTAEYQRTQQRLEDADAQSIHRVQGEVRALAHVLKSMRECEQTVVGVGKRRTSPQPTI